ncbi:hypothetical protein BCF55_0700 [Hydrogenivirga caldilitoris]|uniref:PepSY domain-containing protein n=1 Tax=Hydrogenivirga caldilitoris TaxID=246264 RepID=A0A497XNI6_9AQUI|nr:hypothetical protein [Hydrogenivirga caldilitoris]RLJ70428.1 hypothetical protein BCF55_0700 [Hydrogenivirga caldilitoris]
MKVLVILLFASLSFAGSYHDCIRNAVAIERAIEVARDYVGKPFKVWIGQSKRTGECYWKVNGTEGYIILKAETGEIIKFYRNR